ncbi:MFS transporter [Allorhizocola rhizosphaerae]|uniref:MFS transporter n=1 Tax=Allorhizocola rhizosphaerae TaxID=1872709 RepID=UPI000E3D45C7|nr:MFS transporter [Allorhizocola rhizosphaerae]
MYLSLRDRPTAVGPKAAVPATVFLLGTVSLLTDISSEMVNAVLPLYLTAQIGLGLLAYGFIDGLYQGVSAFVRIAGGYAGDRLGRPKYIAAIGYAVSALCRIALLPAQTFAAISAVITADRLGKGVRTAPRDALIAASVPPSTLGRAFGVHRAMDTIGAALGPLAAFALLWWIPDSYDSIFVVSFVFGLIGVAVLILFVPNTRTSVAKERPRILRAAFTSSLRRPLIAFALLALLTVSDGFIYLSLQQRDAFAAAWFPLLFVGTNVAYLLLAVPLGRLADRVGRGRVLVGGHVALIGAYLLAGGPLTGLPSTVATVLLLGLFYAGTDGVLAALVSRIAAAEARGSAIAAAQTIVVIGRFAASLSFGALWTAVGRGPALLWMAAALTIALPLAAWLLREKEARTA